MINYISVPTAEAELEPKMINVFIIFAGASGFRGRKAIIEPCFGIGLSLSLICQLTSGDIKQHYQPTVLELIRLLYVHRSETVVLFGPGAHDGHLYFHTAPELCLTRLNAPCSGRGTK